MLRSIRIQNFKAWADTGKLRLAPLTVLFGSNSAGKSSLGHLLLALKQTVLSPDRKAALHLGDQNALIDLGTFKDCLHNHDLTKALAFSLKWEMPKSILVKNSLKPSEQYRGRTLNLYARLQASNREQPQVNKLEYRLIDEDQVRLTIIHSLDEAGKIHLDSNPLCLVHPRGRKWPLDPPERFYGFSSRTLAKFQNADFLSDFALETGRLFNQLYYLGPLREPPQRMYSWAGDTPPDVGQRGEFSISALLAAKGRGRKLNRGPKYRYQEFDQFIADWLTDLGVISNFRIAPVAEGRKEYEVFIKTTPGTPEVKLTGVGFGVSQVLPALIQAFYSPPNSIVWMEQPEIHLHPAVQANLADVFISAVQANEDGKTRKTQLIIESHSEHLLTRLQRRIAEKKISPENVAIYFVSHNGEGAKIEELEIDLYGEIKNWPENFFGDEMKDIAARTKAAIDRRKRYGKSRS